MFDHPIFDVSVGLILCYLVLSLVATAVQEWVASMLGLRSRNLRKGVTNLIGDDYARKFYAHPLIKNLAKSGKFPSYIAPQTMSTVILEVVAKDKGDNTFVAQGAREVKDIIESVPPEHPLRGVVGIVLQQQRQCGAGPTGKAVGLV